MARREVQPPVPTLGSLPTDQSGQYPPLVPSREDEPLPRLDDTVLIDTSLGEMAGSLPLPPTSLPTEPIPAPPAITPPAEAPRAIAAVDAETGLIYVKFNGHMTRGQALMFANELRSKANRL